MRFGFPHFLRPCQARRPNSLREWFIFHRLTFGGRREISRCSRIRGSWHNLGWKAGHGRGCRRERQDICKAQTWEDCPKNHISTLLNTTTMQEIIDIPVIIVGGGGCGLSLSCFLSDYGIDHVLFERHHGTSILPKAHYLNQRTMEVFRLHGMTDEIIEKGCPPRQFSQVAWASSLGGNGPLDRKIIAKFGCFGGEDGTGRSEAYK